MSFSGLYTQGVSSTYDEPALALLRQISLHTGFQPGQAASSVFSSLTTLLWQVPSLTGTLKNLTEFLSAPNFSMGDWEGI
jgi:hypothetical protein